MTRLVADGLPRLDVRALARAGALTPGTCATVTWGVGMAITTMVDGDPAATLTLRYQAGTASGDWMTRAEPVPLATTPCTFGGTRPWFVCPGCTRRCAVLYGLGGTFRCRTCHHLAYASMRRPGRRTNAPAATREVGSNHVIPHLAPSDRSPVLEAT